MVRSVPLYRFPEGLQFPPELRQRIAYDPTAKKLAYEGYMSKTHFDKLIRLDKSDEYRRAIEQLFQICEFETEDTSAIPRGKLILLTIFVFALAGCVGFLWFLAR